MKALALGRVGDRRVVIGWGTPVDTGCDFSHIATMKSWVVCTTGTQFGSESGPTEPVRSPDRILGRARGNARSPAPRHLPFNAEADGSHRHQRGCTGVGRPSVPTVPRTRARGPSTQRATESGAVVTKGRATRSNSCDYDALASRPDDVARRGGVGGFGHVVHRGDARDTRSRTPRTRRAPNVRRTRARVPKHELGQKSFVEEFAPSLLPRRALTSRPGRGGRVTPQASMTRLSKSCQKSSLEACAWTAPVQPVTDHPVTRQLSARPHRQGRTPRDTKSGM